MKYFDTNILIYSVVDQDNKKREKSQQLIDGSIKSKEIILSPLSIIEFVFVLEKLKLSAEFIESRLSFFSQFVANSIDFELLKKALVICKSVGKYANINDAVHLAFAQKYADVIYTFDSDFKLLASSSQIKVQLLK